MTYSLFIIVCLAAILFVYTAWLDLAWSMEVEKMERHRHLVIRTVRQSCRSGSEPSSP